MAEGSYFQFPLCALAHGPEFDDRLHHIISYCVLEVGEKVSEDYDDDAGESYKQRNNKSLPSDYETENTQHSAVLRGANLLNVILGSIASILRQRKELNDFIRKFESIHGRSPFVRIKTEYVWEVLKGDGLSYRELTVLCGLYSSIGASEYPVRVTKKTIRHRMLGYKSEAIMKAELTRRNDREKPLTERQVLTTLDKLHSRRFFARLRANARQTYYSNRLTQEELGKALFEMKTRAATSRKNRIDTDRNFMARIKEVKEKARLLVVS